MACPYFLPIARHDAELWPHRRRLPLGDGFRGQCMAPGHEHAEPSDSELGSCCNLGYATDCPRLPAQRPADAVHFCAGTSNNGLINIQWVAVKDHAAAAHGILVYDRESGSWRNAHPDELIQRKAECFLHAYSSRG